MDKSKKIQILYDHQIFNLQKVGGVSRYFYELLTRINMQSNMYGLVSLKSTTNEYMLNYFKKKGIADIEQSPELTTFLPSFNPILRKIVFKIAGKIIPDFHKKKINIEFSKRLLREQTFDFFHPTYFDPYFLPLLKGKPYFITVYDCIHEIFPDSFPVNDFELKWKKEVLASANQIIAISQNTKYDLMKFYGIDEKKIEVIYLSSNMSDVNEKKPDCDIPSQYLLFVGARRGYKNFKLLTNAIVAIGNKYKDLDVVCTGHEFTKDEISEFKSKNIFSRMHHIFVNDCELKYIYINAVALIFPSRYEGFGIPILEAFACGCPAIISKGSSMSEVGGEAAVFFDPDKVETLVEKIDSVMSNYELRNKHIEYGYKRAKLFTWEKMAQKTIELYTRQFERMRLL